MTTKHYAASQACFCYDVIWETENEGNLNNHFKKKARILHKGCILSIVKNIHQNSEQFQIGPI